MARNLNLQGGTHRPSLIALTCIVWSIQISTADLHQILLFKDRCDCIDTLPIIVSIDKLITFVISPAGNRHFAKLQYEEADRCYSSALAALNQGAMLTALLLNSAACYSALGYNAAALHAAAAASAVDPSAAKAHYRAAIALQGLSQLQEALRSCREVRSWWKVYRVITLLTALIPTSNPVRKLRKT